MVDEKTHIMSDLHFKANLNWSAYRHKPITAKVNTLLPGYAKNISDKSLEKDLGQQNTDPIQPNVLCRSTCGWMWWRESISSRASSDPSGRDRTVHVCIRLYMSAQMRWCAAECLKELAVKPDPTCATLAVCNGRAIGMS